MFGFRKVNRNDVILKIGKKRKSYLQARKFRIVTKDILR